MHVRVVAFLVLAYSGCGLTDTRGKFGYSDRDATVVTDTGFSIPIDAFRPQDAGAIAVDAATPDAGELQIPCLDNESCSDGYFCNGEEFCTKESRCDVRNVPEVDDLVPCTVDACDEENHVTHTPDDAVCTPSAAYQCEGDLLVPQTAVCTATGCEDRPLKATDCAAVMHECSMGCDEAGACTVERRLGTCDSGECVLTEVILESCTRETCTPCS